MTRLLGLGVILAFAWVVPARAVEVVLSPPGTNGWKLLNFPKIKQHTTYTAIHSEGLDAVRAVADCSASAMYLPVKVDLGSTPLLQWEWNIEKGLGAPDERVKAGDDFAARVYVMFQFDAQRASLWERLQHTLGTKIYGDIIPGNTINYVWSSHQPKGSTWDSPYTSSAKLRSLGNGPLPQWTEEVVDVAADYAFFFGHEPPPLLAVALMTDSDNTCRQAIASYSAFRFVSR